MTKGDLDGLDQHVPNDHRMLIYDFVGAQQERLGIVRPTSGRHTHKALRPP